MHAFPNDKTGKMFGLTGTFGGKQGVAVSTNGGAVFKRFPISALFTDARYGAFPSPTTWYVAAGEWPASPSSSPPPPMARQPSMVVEDAPAAVSRANPLRKSIFQDENGRIPRHFNPKMMPRDTTGYKAQILKTNDGGNTWTTLFAENKCVHMA